jgi:Holliday junction resolvase-like predicted endonuclease
MEVNKSSRHSKITGNFAESLVLYWLSKYGFECALVDHTGLDVIARNRHTNELMGISVKARSRNTGTEGQYVSIPNDNFPKLGAACEAFGCSPYFALVIDEADGIQAFILSKEHLLSIHPKGKEVVSWKMGDKWVKQYLNDSEIRSFAFSHQTLNWWNKPV